MATSKPEVVHSVQFTSGGQQVIDLTDDFVATPIKAQKDHMSSVIDLIRSRPKKPASNTTFPGRKADDLGRAATSKKSRRRAVETATSPKSPIDSSGADFKVPLGIDIPDPSMAPSASSPPTLLTSHKPTPKRTPFPFFKFPPEMRNKVYSLLLTHRFPIELPPTRRSAAARSAQFAQCQSKRQRRAFKTIFLEILSTNRQVHEEATGILYGSNIFKFRSDHQEKPWAIPFPAKYLPLLRHIKVCVISREQEIEQDKWVAQLLRKFVGARLEDFGITWYGWNRFRLLKDGVLCEALLALKVDKLFAIKVVGKARMERAMLEELEGKCGARKVEIQRPVVTIMRNGGKLEVSDDEVDV